VRFGFQGAKSRERLRFSGAVARFDRASQRKYYLFGVRPDFNLGYEEIESRRRRGDSFEIAEVPSDCPRRIAEAIAPGIISDCARHWFCRLSVQIRFAS
jgi:hypothetical protein